MSRGYDSHSKQKGFSLIEIIVAMAILAIVVVAFAPILSISFKGIIDSGKTSIATYAAQKNIEDTSITGTSVGDLYLTFSKVNDSTTTKTVTISGFNEYVKDSLVYLALAPVPTNITAAGATGFVAPVTDVVPISVGSLTPNDTTYTVTGLAWSPTDNPYAGATTYTATVKLTAAAGYKFPTGGIAALTADGGGTVSAGTTTGGDVSGNMLTYTVQFPATIGEIKAAGVNGLILPVSDFTPQSAGSLTPNPNTATYTITGLTWSPTDSPYSGLTQYTAKVRLTSATGYKFPTGGITTPNADGGGTKSAGTTTGGDVSGNILTYTVQFTATGQNLQQILAGMTSTSLAFTNSTTQTSTKPYIIVPTSTGVTYSFASASVNSGNTKATFTVVSGNQSGYFTRPSKSNYTATLTIKLTGIKGVTNLTKSFTVLVPKSGAITITPQ